MPEAPEVSLIADGLSKLLVGQTIDAVAVTPWQGTKFLRGFEAAAARVCWPLTGVTVANKGKQIYMLFSEVETGKKWYALSHLGMTGCWSRVEEKHAHLTLIIRGQGEVHYCDARKFGNFVLLDDQATFQGVLDALAPSLLGSSDRITLDVFRSNLRRCRQRYLIVCLLDQHLIVSGIGNYLASELLYATRLHPEIRCSQLTETQVDALYHTAVDLCDRSYRAGGMSMKDYRMVDGSQGSFLTQLKVYQRSVTPDGHPITKSTGKHGRAVHWDQLVQVPPA
jgi:formamidopyrimidine-DNA glycosylase